MIHTDWSDIVDPLTWLGGRVTKVVADSFTVAMMSLWAGGLYVLRFVLGVLDLFLTPDLRENGPGAVMYQTTFWFASVLVLFMAMIQFGTAASAATARPWRGSRSAPPSSSWSGYVGHPRGRGRRRGVRADQGDHAHHDGCGRWSQWEPWESVQVEDITDTGVAVVLGVMGIFLIFAAIGHLLIMLTRAGALLVLVATGPIAAAGLISEFAGPGSGGLSGGSSRRRSPRWWSSW